MAKSTLAVPSLDGYQLRLPIYEGPLDLLLRLIEREQLEISEVSLLTVLDQFVTYMQNLSSPPTVVAEFLAVAGRLSVLKSRALLPRLPRAVEESDSSDLVQQLEEYRAVKAAAELLAGRQREGAGAFGRGDSIVSPEPVLLHFFPQPPIALSMAIGRWLTRIPVRPVVMATRRIVTLQEMISRISSTIGRKRRISFDAVLMSCRNREDVAVAFLALLVLLRRQAIHATQTELFGPIDLRRADDPRMTSAVPAAFSPEIGHAST